MSIKKGSTNIDKIYHGSTKIGHVFMGSTLVYPPGGSTFLNQYELRISDGVGGNVPDYSRSIGFSTVQVKNGSTILPISVLPTSHYDYVYAGAGAEAYLTSNEIALIESGSSTIIKHNAKDYWIHFTVPSGVEVTEVSFLAQKNDSSQNRRYSMMYRKSVVYNHTTYDWWPYVSEGIVYYEEANTFTQVSIPLTYPPLPNP